MYASTAAAAVLEACNAATSEFSCEVAEGGTGHATGSPDGVAKDTSTARDGFGPFDDDAIDTRGSALATAQESAWRCDGSERATTTDTGPVVPLTKHANNVSVKSRFL